MDRSREILFEITEAENALFVANGGRPFVRKGVISVCNSHLSNKRPGGVTDHFHDANDEQLVQAIRNNELDHYKDPNRIHADFSDEEETVRDYGGRLILELLQNADDTMGESVKPADLIGSKGLGFKAVLEVTDEPEIHSDCFHFLFSASRTQELLKEKRLHADPPRLTFRVPHECKPDERVRDLLAAGYSTVIRLPFRDAEARKTVIERLCSLDALFLLLTQELSCVHIRVAERVTVHEIVRQAATGLSSGDVQLSTRSPSGFQSTSWRRWVRSCPAPNGNGKKLTVAICLPLAKRGSTTPSDKDIPFHVFFPTEEKSGTRALIHASLDLEHNRKRIRKGDYDDDIRREFRGLFQDVLAYISAQTALGAFGRVGPGDEKSPLMILLKDIRDTLCDTCFVPVIGGGRVKPGEVQLWGGRLGTVLRDDAEQVRAARLLVPELCDLKNVLENLGAQAVKEKDYIRLLRYCCNSSLEKCLESWRALVEDGLKEIPPYSSSSDRGDMLEDLRNVPCWWTKSNEARALDGNPPLLFERPENWPDWLPADSLHPTMKQTAEDWEAKAKEQESVKIWKESISKWLLKKRDEFLHDVLLPFVHKWDGERWEGDGWQALRQVLFWSPAREFEKVSPWVESPKGSQEEKQRAKAAKSLRLPIEDEGWLPAADCYAGKVWDGPPVFDLFFASVEGRGLVRSFQKWPAHVREATTEERWKALLRWTGVSWEPKVQFVRGKPKHCLVGEYIQAAKVNQYYRQWKHDWEIEAFPDCIYNAEGGDKPASIIKMMLPLVEAIAGHKYRAEYSCSYSRQKPFVPEVYTNFADYQLRHEKWLPCKPSLLYNNRKVAPHDAFEPGQGLGGLLPEVDGSGIKDEEWFRDILGALRELGVRDKLPDDPKDWREWMRKLQNLANGLDDSAPESSKDGDKVRHAAEALYRGYLKLDDGIDLFPAEIKVPCTVWENGRETLAFRPPKEVFLVDEPHFDEVSRDLICKGEYRLFILRLGSGAKATERLGVRPLSEELRAEPCYALEIRQDSERLRQRYSERRLGLNLAAKLENLLPEDLGIIAVRGLKLKLAANERHVADVPVLSWRRNNDALLLNLDKDKWRALGHGLAVRVAGRENNGSLFEALLREDDKKEFLDRLRHAGVTADDIKHAVQSWIPDVEVDQTPDQEVEPEREREQKHGPQSQTGGDQGSEEMRALGSRSLHQTVQRRDDGQSSEGRRGQDQELQRIDKGWDNDGTIQNRDPAGRMNGAQRPRPETGLNAEDWLEERLKKAFPSRVERHVRDHENRESDFVISDDGRTFHIEVKHSASWPGTFYWSGLQCEKAQELKESDGNYFMAILFPNGNQSYEIRWIWHPLDELRGVSREVQWEGKTDYQRVKNIDSWDVANQRPEAVLPKRYSFRIRLKNEIVERFDRDTEALKVLRNKIGAVH